MPEESPEAAAPVAENDEGDIVVTGFRASLESAVNEKKQQDQIVESVSAEDIGKLPDASIAESIARLPGVTSQRLSGRANVISIRGFGPDYLDDPAERPRADLDRRQPRRRVRPISVRGRPPGQRLQVAERQPGRPGPGRDGRHPHHPAARLLRPAGPRRRRARISYADLGKLNSGSRDIGYRLNATFVDQNADDTFGVALAASYVDEPYQIQEYNAWGYPGSGTATDPYVIGGSKSYVTSTRLKRFGAQGTLQFKPTRTLTATVDAFYSNFKDDQIKRGIELPLAWGNASFVPGSGQVQNGFLVSGTATGVEGVIRNDAFERHANLYSGGLNLNYEGDGGLNAFLDIGYSRTDRNELILESYSGTGFGAGNGARDTISFQATERGIIFDPTLNYSDTSLIKLTDPQGWGGGVLPQVGYYNNRIVDDEFWQFRGEVEKELETGFLSAVKAGVNYTVREKSLDPDEAIIRLGGGALEMPIPPSSCGIRPTSTISASARWSATIPATCWPPATSTAWCPTPQESATWWPRPTASRDHC